MTVYGYLSDDISYDYFSDSFEYPQIYTVALDGIWPPSRFSAGQTFEVAISDAVPFFDGPPPSLNWSIGHIQI